MGVENRPIIKSQENWESFHQRLSRFTEVDQERISASYELAKYAHRSQQREDGERYFEHVRSVALILLDECNTDDASEVCGALLHDTAEDTAIFANAHRLPRDKWLKRSHSRIALNFGEETAEIVLSVTIPHIDGEVFKDKESVQQAYHHQLESASPKAIIVKMADRLHNLRTLKATGEDRTRRKIAETHEKYMPIFTRLAEGEDIASARARVLLEKIANELDSLEKSII